MELKDKFCPNCGQKLIYKGIQLSEDDMDKNAYYSNKELAAKQYLNNAVINNLNLTDTEAYSYFKAAFDLLTEAYFLKYIWQKEMKDKYGIDFSNDLIDEEGKVYGHADCSNHQS